MKIREKRLRMRQIRGEKMSHDRQMRRKGRKIGWKLTRKEGNKGKIKESRREYWRTGREKT